MEIAFYLFYTEVTAQGKYHICSANAMGAASHGDMLASFNGCLLEYVAHYSVTLILLSKCSCSLHIILD